MAATWTIINAERAATLETKEDVVTTLHWECTDSDGEHFGRCYGSITLDTSNLSNFTAFADLTDKKLVEWAKARLGNDTVAQSEEDVAEQISKSKTPQVILGRPS
jgi:hypothetical protein